MTKLDDVYSARTGTLVCETCGEATSPVLTPEQVAEVASSPKRFETVCGPCNRYLDSELRDARRRA